MRPPQSFTRRFCARVFSIVVFSGSAVLLSLGQGAAAAQQLMASPSTLNYGNVQLGHNETQLIVLKNNGSTKVTVSTMKVLGNEFTASNISVPFTVAAGQSVSVNLTFTPSVSGWSGGSVDFISNASNSSVAVQLQGNGQTSNTLTAAPSVVSFGQVAVGASSTRTVVLTNDRHYKIQIYGWHATGGGFSVSGPALPLTLNSGQSVTVKAKFAPSSTGISTGDIFVSNEGLNIPLSGTGTDNEYEGAVERIALDAEFRQCPGRFNGYEVDYDVCEWRKRNCGLRFQQQQRVRYERPRVGAVHDPRRPECDV